MIRNRFTITDEWNDDTCNDTGLKNDVKISVDTPNVEQLDEYKDGLTLGIIA